MFNLSKPVFQGLSLVGMLILISFSGSSLYARWLMNLAGIEYAKSIVHRPDAILEVMAEERLYRDYSQAATYEPALRQRGLYQVLPLLISTSALPGPFNGICPREGEDFLFLRLLRKVEVYTKTQHYDEAERILSWLAQNCPASFEVFSIWADLKKARGDYDAGIQLLKKAITLVPQLAPADFRQPDIPESLWRKVALARAHTDIGVLLQKKYQYEQAIVVLESSLIRYPSGTVSPWLYNLIGVLCFEVGYLDKSKWAFEKGLAIEPDLPDAPDYLERIETKRRTQLR